MKKIIFFAVLFIVSCCAIVYGQVGTITTYASTSMCNIAVDNAGRVYGANGDIYRIDSGGATHLVAGGGSSYGDGGTATAAQISNATKVAFDNSGNMYICDHGFGVVRKINSGGIISTVAGNHILGTGYTGDGGLATNAKLNCDYICFDPASNLYIADATDHVVRRVSPTGYISTVAGNTSSSASGDGGPATSAGLGVGGWGTNNFSIAADIWGNLYIGDGSNLVIRKVNSAGIITNYAGNGTSAADASDVPATSVSIYPPQGFASDNVGNLYVAQWQNCVVGSINPMGIYYTVAGNYTVSFSGDGGPATAAALNAVSDVAIAPNGDVYISDCHNSCIRKVTGSYMGGTYVADSFGVFINMLCSGPQLTIATRSYVAAYNVKTYYGDGAFDTAHITSAYTSGGMASLSHIYNAPGTYTIKTVLYNGSTPFDSLSYAYNYRMCNTLSTKFYMDANNNCIFDSGDSHLSLPVLTEVDSNGVAIDTISSTSGLYYTAYGHSGDVYQFKVISSPGNLHPRCPSTGIITDTLQTAYYNNNLTSVGFQCDTVSSYDLAVKVITPVTGVHDQWGNIYVSNTHCIPENATVTLHYSRHYRVDMGGGSLDVSPTPSSYTDSTITWNVSALSNNLSAPIDLYYAIWTNPDSGMVVGFPAWSYCVVNPTGGDCDTGNNSQTWVDTVRGGCDPNEMWVSPAGYITAGTNLTYTINFTNTGNDTTYDVYIMDTLSDNVDISSFRMVMSSATMNVAKLKWEGHNILKFDFPNINLLDSIHHPHDCTRGLVFTINTLSGLLDGTTIFNHAGIFFDYNPVVMTETVEDIIGAVVLQPTMAEKAKISLIYPNPAGNRIVLDNRSSAARYVICDMVGSNVATDNIKSGNNSLDISTLPQGVYHLRLDSGEVLRFVKL